MNETHERCDNHVSLESLTHKFREHFSPPLIESLDARARRRIGAIICGLGTAVLWAHMDITARVDVCLTHSRHRNMMHQGEAQDCSEKGGAVRASRCLLGHKNSLRPLRDRNAGPKWAR
eukprot:22615-Prymnesium_polylepis.1